MSDKGRPGRREFLHTGSVAFLAALSVAGCDLLSTQPAEEQKKQKKGGRQSTAKEAPQLARQVKAGKLPPVEDRLPQKPMVVKPTERVGAYGGECHAMLAGTSTNYIRTLCEAEYPVRWVPHPSGAAGTKDVTENLVEGFEVSADGTALTFHLRPGTKWSDGQPYTADDVLFAVEDVALNPEIHPVPPSILTGADGDVARLEKLDDYSFRLVSSKPLGLFFQFAAVGQADFFARYPPHYLKKFHPKYNADVQRIVEREGFDDWVQLFGAKADFKSNPDLPCLYPWRMVRAYGTGPRVVLERNPYYWKVDPEGRQLPYIDRVVFEVNVTEETAILKISNGDINFEVPPENRFANARNKPVLARSRAKGGYRFIDGAPTRPNVAGIHVNLTHRDPAKRKVFQNKDFRIGLSHAIDRQEANELILAGQGEPYQVAPLPESMFYDKEFANQYLKYDVELANEYLDRVMPNKNSDGMRLGPDGKPFSFMIELVLQWNPQWADLAELLREYWRRVGVEVRAQARGHSYFITRAKINKFDAAIWIEAGGLAALVRPKGYLPMTTQSFFAPLWANWYIGREPKEEPPEATKRQMQLYDQVLSTLDPDEQVKAMEEVLAIAKEQFYVIGTLRTTNLYFVAANNYRNLPKTITSGYQYQTPSITWPEQHFIDKE